MRSEVIARVKEPFFTTRPPGQDTGLGLAMAQNFTKRRGGLLRIDSRVGRGTIVALSLPKATLSGVLSPDNL
jgi:signal transduction histidine kinase